MHQPRNEQPPAIFSLSPTAIDFDNAAVMTRLPPELVQVSPGCRIFCSPPGFCLMNKLQDYAPTKKPRARIEKVRFVVMYARLFRPALGKLPCISGYAYELRPTRVTVPTRRYYFVRYTVWTISKAWCELSSRLLAAKTPVVHNTWYFEWLTPT